MKMHFYEKCYILNLVGYRLVKMNKDMVYIISDSYSK